MAEVRDFLKQGERLADKVTCFKPEIEAKYIIYTLLIDDIQSEDDVILEIDKNTEPCVLIGGNNLELTTLSGLGRLSVLDLATGDKNETLLEPGTSVVVPSNNTVYWYENLGTEPLFVRDHCDDFNFENEPTLENVADALVRLT